MIGAAISFFVLALVAYFLGANGIAGLSIEIGKIFLMVFLAFSVITFLASLFKARKRRQLL